MRKTTCFIILYSLLFCNVIYGQQLQTSEDLLKIAKEKYDAKDYQISAQLYEKAFGLIENKAIGSPRYMAAYNSACSWALALQRDSAFSVLTKIASEESFGTYYSQMLKDKDFISLHEDKRWKAVYELTEKQYKTITQRQIKALADLQDPSKRANTSLLTDSAYWYKQASELSLKSLINKIRKFDSFETPGKTKSWTLYKTKVNDTLEVSFLLYIPEKYQPQKSTPLYIFLHGGVGRNAFSDPLAEIPLDEPVLKRPIQQQAFIIVPFANKNLNWLYHQEAFETILKDLNQVKSLYNIDDNRVYLGGHSDGARGAFWFALNKRTPFASFYGMNYYPSLLTGNTSIRNLKNESAFNGISGLDDKGFNPKQVTQLVNYAKSVGANWNNTLVQGGHGLPYDSPDSTTFLFDKLITQKRNPLPKTIELEVSDIRNNQSFWLNITQLDTVKDAAKWHIDYNPTLTSIKTGKDELINFNKKKSGAVIATITDNNLYVKTSRVKELELNVPEEWGDRYKTLKIFLNDNKPYIVKINPDKKKLVEEFMRTKDRKLLIVDSIKITVK